MFCIFLLVTPPSFSERCCGAIPDTDIGAQELVMLRYLNKVRLSSTFLDFLRRFCRVFPEFSPRVLAFSSRAFVALLSLICRSFSRALCLDLRWIAATAPASLGLFFPLLMHFSIEKCRNCPLFRAFG